MRRVTHVGVSSPLILVLLVAVIALTALTVHHRTEARAIRAQLSAREEDVRDVHRYRETFASIQHRANSARRCSTRQRGPVG